jgi:hypothetical protein
MLYIWSGERLSNLARRKCLLNMHSITPLRRRFDRSSNRRSNKMRPFPITARRVARAVSLLVGFRHRRMETNMLPELLI